MQDKNFFAKLLSHKRITFILFLTVLAMFFFISVETSKIVGERLPPPESYTNVIVGESTPKGGFNQPHYLALADNGNMYVADSGNNAVQVLDRNGKFLFSFGAEGKGPGQLSFPDGIAISPKDEVYVGEIDNQRIQVFSLKGKFLREFRPHRPFKPGAMLFDKTGDLYVADLSHQQVVIFNQNDALKLAFGQPGRGEGELAFPSGIYPTASEIFVSDTNNGRIQVFTKEGKYLRSFGDQKEGPDSLILPVGIGGFGSQIYVVDTFDSKHSIKVFNPQGKVVYTIGSKGLKDREFNLPEGLAVDAKGLLYIADTGNNRVQVLSLSAQNK
ncbi:MAG TPA: 6-bladed beta-propeller [Verrucomicrobiae bacterium]|nr:6-bladed beta-propeller [Verrucomicrobiae bacterium]